MVVHGTRKSRIDLQRHRQVTEIPSSPSRCSNCNSTFIKYHTGNMAQCNVCFHQWRWVPPMMIERRLQKLQSGRFWRSSPSPPPPPPEDAHYGADEDDHDTYMAEFDKRIFDWMDNVTTDPIIELDSNDFTTAAVDLDKALLPKKLLEDATITPAVDSPMEEESPAIMTLSRKNLHIDSAIAPNLDTLTNNAPFVSLKEDAAVATTVNSYQTTEESPMALYLPTTELHNDTTISTTMDGAMDNSPTAFILPEKKIRDDTISAPKTLNLPKKKLWTERTITPILGAPPKGPLQISSVTSELPRKKLRRKVTTVASTLPAENSEMESAPAASASEEQPSKESATSLEEQPQKESTSSQEDQLPKELPTSLEKQLSKDSIISSDLTTNFSPLSGSSISLTTTGNLFIPKRRQKVNAPATTATTTTTITSAEHQFAFTNMNNNGHSYNHHIRRPQQSQDATASTSNKSTYPNILHSTLLQSTKSHLDSSFSSTHFSSSSHTKYHDAGAVYAEQVKSWSHENPVPGSSSKSPRISSTNPSQQQRQQISLPPPYQSNNSSGLQYSRYVPHHHSPLDLMKRATSRTSAAQELPLTSSLSEFT